MGIISRVLRLCKADIHGFLDRMEDKGLLLKQYLRDMEAELGRKEGNLKNLQDTRNQAQKEYDHFDGENEKLNQDLATFIQTGRDDLARMLIRKLKTQGHFQEDVRRHIETLTQEIVQLQDCLTEQRLQYEQLQRKAAPYLSRSRRDVGAKTIGADITYPIFREPSDAEIELELLQYKESIKGGA